MTVRRHSYSPKNVVRFLPVFDELIRQIKNKKVTGAFISKDRFPEMKLETLLNRMTDALKWLRDNADIPEKVNQIEHYRPGFKAQDYEFLRQLLKTKIEARGIRLTIIMGFDPELLVSDVKTPAEVATVKAAPDWKVELNNFIQNSNEKLKTFTNCIFNPGDEVWIRKVIVEELKGEFFINGDKLTVMKP